MFNVIMKNGYGAVLAVLGICMLAAAPVQAERLKVLSVMSYHEEFPWSKDLKEGIDNELRDKADVTYFWLDTRNNPQGGAEKGKQAYELYQKLQPDGVIASDDNAQTYVVIPFLKDKVKTPVIFCGVNEDPEKYGFPSSNVTGVLEVVHFRESIAYLQELVPTVKTIAYMVWDDSTGRAFIRQAQKEADTYPAKSVAFKTPKTITEAVKMAEELKTQSDALFVELLEGIPDATGKPMTGKEAVPVVVKAFGKPTFCANKFTVKEGALCAVIKLAQEQGELGSQMLLKAMQGTPIAQIPITRNKRGKAVINATALKELGIKPNPMALQNAEVVKTGE